MFKGANSLVLIIVLCAGSLNGQTATADSEKALQKVFEVLSGKEKSNCSSYCDSLINIGAWESLAYVDLNAAFNLSLEDIDEAVPDYYQFKEGQLFFKLINPENHNEYGYVGKLQYTWQAQSIKVIDPKSQEVKDKWEVLYLDSNYLALQMDDLRVFLTHVAPVH
jgi:hypothetical protein